MDAAKDNDDSIALKQPEVTFVLTGFGRFGKITQNPTETIVQHFLNFDDHQRHNYNDDNDDNQRNSNKYNVLLCKIINTSASSVANDIEGIMSIVEEQVKSLISNHKNHHVVCIHFGVDYSCDTFKLETTAYNEASFRIPDEDGYQPKKKPIDDRFPIEQKLQTDLNIRKICNEMKKRDFNVKISGDCGRFVCNFLYWSSLNKIKTIFQSVEWEEINSDQKNVHSMFVHVPMFNVIELEIQLKFVANLLDSIYQNLTLPLKKKKSS